MTLQQPAETSRPSSYHLVLPDGWWRIDLRPDQATASIDRLLARQLANLGEVPQLRRELRAVLRGQAEAAYEAGGVELYLSFMPAEPMTIPASLLVSVPPPLGTPTDPEQLREAIKTAGPAVTLDVVDLPAGRALRRHTRRMAPLDAAPARAGNGSSIEPDETTESFGVDFYLPIPHSDALLVLAFSSPLMQLEEVLLDLFDTVADTVRWV